MHCRVPLPPGFAEGAGGETPGPVAADGAPAAPPLDVALRKQLAAFGRREQRLLQTF
jgi:hypothetical protein